MIELIIAAGVAAGLGALATFLLATHIPEQLLLAGQNHGRYAGLNEDIYASHTGPSEKRQISDDSAHPKVDTMWCRDLLRGGKPRTPGRHY